MHRKKPVPESLFNKVACLQTRTLSKRDSGTSVFLGTLQNFPEQLFYRTHSNSCFCKSSGQPTAVKYFCKRSIIDIQLGSEYASRFVDISMETFINGFSFFWIFSTFWALAAFSQVNCFSFVSRSMLKMFELSQMETYKPQVISVNHKNYFKLSHVNP